jgi:chemotaxis protein histidine kinase CheA
MAEGPDRAAILTKFRDEIHERIQSLVNGVLALEKKPADAEALHGLLRQTHTLKGVSGMLGAVTIKELVHRTEDLLQWLRDGPGECSAEVAEILLASTDLMTELFDAAEQGQFELPRDEAFTALLERIALTVAEGSGEPAAKPAAKPAATPAAKPRPNKPAASAEAGQESLRVATDKLDRLVSISRVLTTGAARERDLLERLKQIRNQAKDANGSPLLAPIEALLADYEIHTREVGHLIDDLAHVAADTRMVPIRAMFDGLSRLIRDLSRKHGTPIRVNVEGESTHFDKRIVDELRGPLLHAINNVFDHGFEDPDTRKRAGKPAEGTLTLKAYHRGESAVVEVVDDGRGIDAARARRLAVQRGLLQQEESARLSDEEARYLIFAPGFSTREQVGEASGRGVGLDAIKRSVEQLDGRVVVESQEGKGTRMAIEMPLVLAMMRVLVVRVNGHQYAIPTATIERAVHFSADSVSRIGGREAIIVEGAGVPLITLANALGIDVPAQARNGRNTAIVLQHLGQRMAFAVDDLVREDGVVVRALGKIFADVEKAAGATVLGGGEVAVVLQVGGLMRAAGGTVAELSKAGPVAATAAHTILVVDDSMNARELLRSLLLAAGHEVVVAVNGVDGLEKARNQAFDLVVTDVEMPEMNGLELTRRLRVEEGYQRKPIIIITTRDHPDDRKRGMDAGASAYLIKDAFEQPEFLRTVARLLG